MDLKDKHVLVIGSEQPWLEAMILEAGASKVTTLGTTYMRLLKIVTIILIDRVQTIGVYSSESDNDPAKQSQPTVP